MGSFDHLLTQSPETPAPSGGAFDHLLTKPADEGPKSIGRAAQDLTPEQEYRQRLVQKKLEIEGEPGYGYRFKDNFTMGLNRPISGVAALPGADAPEGISAGEKWRAGVGAEEDYARRAEANTNKYAGAAVDILGGLATGGPGAALSRGVGKVAVQAPSFLSKVGRAMLGSAGSSAIEGAARNSESVENAVTGGVIGGGVGGVTGGVLGAATSRLPGVRGAQKEVNEAVREGGAKGLTDKGGAIYQKLDNADIKYSARETPKLIQDTVQVMATKGFNKNLHDELIPALEEIGNLKGKSVTWAQLQNIRTQISDASASDDKRVRKMAGHLKDVLNDFVDTARPTLPPRSVGINVPAEAKEARDLWHRGSKASTVEYLADKGMLAGKNPGRKLETNFGTELDRLNKPGRFDAFASAPEQKGIMGEIAKGDPRLAKIAGALNTTGNQLLGYGTAGAIGGAAIPHLIGGDQFGIGSGTSTAGMAAIALGLGAKRGGSGVRNMIANRGQARVDDLIRNIVTGSSNRDVVNTPRDALAKVLAAEQLKRAGARYSSNFFDKE